MKRDYPLKVFVTLLAGLLCSVATWAQQITVNGVVQDTQGEPIIGANILIKGTASGTITDLDGNFQLTADADAILVISFIGYQTVELPAQPVMNITLRDDSKQLDEVVDKLDETEKKLLAIRYFGKRKLLCEFLKNDSAAWSERKYFRRQNKLCERLGGALDRVGITEEVYLRDFAGLAIFQKVAGFVGDGRDEKLYLKEKKGFACEG